MDEKLIELKESALSYLDRFEGQLPQLVNELRAADSRRLGMVPDAAEGAKWLADAAMAITGDGSYIDRLADALAAMEEAVSNRDNILLADILEYELLELAAEIRGRLEG